MNRIHVTTGWYGDGLSTKTAFRPTIADDHPVTSCVDVTGANPHNGGTFVVEILCDDATLASIQSDPKYAGKTQTVTNGS
jgi:hypothetical protein